MSFAYIIKPTISNHIVDNSVAPIKEKKFQMYTCASVFVFIIKKRLNHARTETEMAHHRVLNWWIPELNIRFMIMMKTMMTSSRVFAFGGRNFHYFFFEAVNLSLKSPPPPKKKPIKVEMTKRSQYICESIVYPLSSMVIIFCVLSQREERKQKHVSSVVSYQLFWWAMDEYTTLTSKQSSFPLNVCMFEFFFILLILFLTVMMMMMMVAVHPVSSSSSSYI